MADREGSLLERLEASVSEFRAKQAKDPSGSWRVRESAEAGDLDSLIEHIREKLSPKFAQLAVNAIEGRYRKPAYRPRDGRIFERNFEIFCFISNHVDEGTPLRKAKALARKQFQVSKFILDIVCKGHFETKK
jgi:hypothetical protein